VATRQQLERDLEAKRAALADLEAQHAKAQSRLDQVRAQVAATLGDAPLADLEKIARARAEKRVEVDCATILLEELTRRVAAAKAGCGEVQAELKAQIYNEMETEYDRRSQEILKGMILPLYAAVRDLDKLRTDSFAFARGNMGGRGQDEMTELYQYLEAHFLNR
jgi:hypothetical protein